LLPMLFSHSSAANRELHSFPTRRSSDLEVAERMAAKAGDEAYGALTVNVAVVASVEQVLTVPASAFRPPPKVESAVVRLMPLERSEEHTSELQSPDHLVCRLLLGKKK